MSELRGFKELQIARDSLMKAGNKSPSLRQQSAYVTSNKKQITKKVSETVYQGGSIILQEAARQTGSSYFPKPKVTSKLPPVSGVNATGLSNKSNAELFEMLKNNEDPQEYSAILYELKVRGKYKDVPQNQIDSGEKETDKQFEEGAKDPSSDVYKALWDAGYRERREWGSTFRELLRNIGLGTGEAAGNILAGTGKGLGEGLGDTAEGLLDTKTILVAGAVLVALIMLKN